MEIVLNAGVNLLSSFADKLNTTIDSSGKVIIPEQFGNGYLQGFIFNKNLRMMIQNFELKEDLMVKRTFAQNDTEKVIITFHNFFLSNAENYDSTINTKKLQSIQVFSGKLETEKFFSSKTLFKSIIIGIEIAYLKELLKGDYENTILNTITGKDKSFLFEELMPASIQKVVHEMLVNPIPSNLNNFYHKVKAEELICLLIAELLKRENAAMSALNIDDVQTIYKIRDTMLKQLEIAPNLDELATIANFSKSKLKRLFKQIFGTSLFNYYQSFRMQEAANLLREHKLSVSEVGFRLGFSNLSHFTRLFEAHIGVKPKRWSMES
ncbi:AraC family transcriptional regulator [Flavobacterium sp. 5]|uniref:helix-turn-helix domain-containing protein n=1 Tax=Flavobacterium sp. 5 TaxID=2035199 RepID=UPI000C2B5D3C|nr:AraC family transcriptional regulator [Flavobacterium sp. 5]PKB15297.1 AraC-like DNA-binding protein [Flavobacterium sp. 5]